MSTPGFTRVLAASIALLFCVSSTADAQISRLKKAAKDAAERETANQVDQLVAEAVQCAFDDPRCIEEAEESGQPVVMTDHDGNVITNDAGEPVSDPTEAEQIAGTDGPAGRPGEGVWANYDFVPGERVLFAEYFEKDRVGDWPRRLEFLNGNAEIVEWEGGRFLRANDETTFEIVLVETLPETFTMEFDLNIGAPHIGTYIFVHVGDGSRINTSQYPGNYFAFNSDRIRPESTPTLREIGEMLQDHEDMSLLIEGHTDAEGDDSYNQELSERRARAVVNYLVAEYGLDEARLAAEGFGESMPTADNATPEGRQQNRRVELVVR